MGVTGPGWVKSHLAAEGNSCSTSFAAYKTRGKRQTQPGRRQRNHESETPSRVMLGRLTKRERSPFGATELDLVVSANPLPKNQPGEEQSQPQEPTQSFLPHRRAWPAPPERGRAPAHLQTSLTRRFGPPPAVTNEPDNGRLTHAPGFHESQPYGASENTAPSYLSGEGALPQARAAAGGLLRTRAGTQRIHINTERKHKGLRR